MELLSYTVVSFILESNSNIFHQRRVDNSWRTPVEHPCITIYTNRFIITLITSKYGDLHM